MTVRRLSMTIRRSMGVRRSGITVTIRRWLVDDVGVSLGSGVTGVVSVVSITMAIASVVVVTISVDIFKIYVEYIKF